MLAMLLHPLALTLLTVSLVLAGVARFLPAASGLAGLSSLLAYMGLAGYWLLIVALLGFRSRLKDVLPQVEALEALSERRIKKDLRREALYHPTSLMFLAVTGLLLLYLAVFWPGGTTSQLVVLLLCFFVVAMPGCFLWRYRVRFEEHYRNRVQGLADMMDEAKSKSEREEWESLFRRLKDGFSSYHSEAGLRALRRLRSEYNKLTAILEEASSEPSLSHQAAGYLATSTYRRGLSVLADVLVIVEATEGPEKAILELEIDQLQRKLRGLGSTGADDSEGLAFKKMKEETLQSHQRRLELLAQLQIRLSHLLHLADRCEASMHCARMELACLRTGDTELSIDQILSALQGTVRRAREVQEEVRLLSSQ